MKMCEFKSGMTVAQLKEILREWPETDDEGEPCEVWFGDNNGFSNQITKVTPLNMRNSESGSKAYADILFEIQA